VRHMAVLKIDGFLIQTPVIVKQRGALVQGEIGIFVAIGLRVAHVIRVLLCVEGNGTGQGGTGSILRLLRGGIGYRLRHWASIFHLRPIGLGWNCPIAAWGRQAARIRADSRLKFVQPLRTLRNTKEYKFTALVFFV
jgi:hypothetical protein